MRKILIVLTILCLIFSFAFTSSAASSILTASKTLESGIVMGDQTEYFNSLNGG